jgi:hypothetical protein
LFMAILSCLYHMYVIFRWVPSKAMGADGNTLIHGYRVHDPHTWCERMNEFVQEQVSLLVCFFVSVLGNVDEMIV